MNQNQNEKLEINQNMFNQYNFYQGIMSPIGLMQIQQLNNQNINFQNINNQEYLQNFYYMQNPYSFIPNDREFIYYEQEEETLFNDLKGHINNLCKRGISNNIIGAFFIEENKEKNKETNDEEEEKIKIKKGEKDEKYHNLNYDKNCELEYNNESLRIKKEIENENKRQENINFNDKDDNNKNRLIMPVLIW